MIMAIQITAFVISFIYLLFLIIELARSKEIYLERIVKFSLVFLIPLFVIHLFLTVIHQDGSFPAGSSIGIISINGIMFITMLFQSLIRKFEQAWLRIIYYIGIFCTIFASVEFVTGRIQYEGFFTQVFGGTIAICAIISVSTFMVYLVALFLNLFKGGYKIKPIPFSNPGVNHNKLVYYRQRGLTEQEILFFRQQMSEAKGRIKNIEKDMLNVAKLRVIETRHNTIDVTKQFFKDIVAEPERLPQAGTFINKLLPSLEDLAAKYNEISQHVAKTKQTYLILDKSAATIEKICESISEQYVQFHQSLYNDLDDEIKLANRTLTKVAKSEHSDTVDDLISDPFNFEEE